MRLCTHDTLDLVTPTPPQIQLCPINNGYFCTCETLKPVRLWSYCDLFHGNIFINYGNYWTRETLVPLKVCVYSSPHLCETLVFDLKKKKTFSKQDFEFWIMKSKVEMKMKMLSLSICQLMQNSWWQVSFNIGHSKEDLQGGRAIVRE